MPQYTCGKVLFEGYVLARFCSKWVRYLTLIVVRVFVRYWQTREQRSPAPEKGKTLSKTTIEDQEQQDPLDFLPSDEGEEDEQEDEKNAGTARRRLQEQRERLHGALALIELANNLSAWEMNNTRRGLSSRSRPGPGHISYKHLILLPIVPLGCYDGRWYHYMKNVVLFSPLVKQVRRRFVCFLFRWALCVNECFSFWVCGWSCCVFVKDFSVRVCFENRVRWSTC